MKNENWNTVVEGLKVLYPNAECALLWGRGHENGWKLLVLGILSAQCTDKRVNVVSVPLFERFPTVESLAYSDVKDIEEIVKPCGLYRTKASNIQGSARILFEKYGGLVPEDMGELLSLPGVGRKIANLLRGDIYKIPGIVADTHCIRICGRLGMYGEDVKDPHKVERIVSSLIDGSEQTDFCHRIVLFGRDICSARSPKCEECPIRSSCRHYLDNY